MQRNEMLKVIYGTHVWKDLRGDFLADAKRAKTVAQALEFASKWQWYFLYDTAANTLKGRSVTMRKELESIDKANLCELFKVPSNVYSELSKAYNEEVKEELSEEATDTTMINACDTIDAIKSRLLAMLESGDIGKNSPNSRLSREQSYIKIILIALSTGRRQYEIMKTLSVSKKKDLVCYAGVAKKKGENSDEVIAPSLFLEADVMRKWLVDIRKEFGITEGMTSKEINSKFNASIFKAFVRYVPELQHESFHFCRTLYAECAFVKFGKGDKTLYFSEVLGHEYKAQTTDSYIAKSSK